MKSLVILTVLCLLTGNLKAATYGGGIGTPTQPYLISTPSQLNQIGANPGDWGACFKLMANVNMSAYTGTQYNIIGTSTTNFTGSFDGNNHVIQNLTYSSTTTNYVGLFGYVGYGGKIKNLGIENVNITGYGYVGGLVGYNYSSSLTDCYSSGSVSGTGSWVGGLAGWNNGTLTACYATGSVTGTGSYDGGLVGYNHGTLTACYSTGSVTGASYVGGLVGQNYSSSLTDCYSTGSVSGTGVIGGLVGYNYLGTISNCYSTDTVIGTIYYIGGLVGWNYSSSLTDCYSSGSVSGTSSVGGLVGYNYESSISSSYFLITSGPNNGYGTPLTDAQMKQQSSFVGWDFTNETANGTNDYWRMCVDGVNYPQLNWQSITGDFACPDGVNTEDLRYFAGRWLESDCAPSNNYCGGADMDASGVVDFMDYALFASQWLEGVTP